MSSCIAFNMISFARLLDLDSGSFGSEKATRYMCLQGQFFITFVKGDDGALIASKVGGHVNDFTYKVAWKRPLVQRMNGDRCWEIELLKRRIQPKYGSSYDVPDKFVLTPRMLGVVDGSDEVFHPVIFEMKAVRESPEDGRRFAPPVVRFVRCLQVPQDVIDIDRRPTWKTTE